MIIRQQALAAALLALSSIAACKRSQPTTRGVASSAQSGSPEPRHSARGATSAVAPTASVASPPPAVAPSWPRCKAAGQKQAVGIGLGPDELLQMHAESGYVYVLSYLDLAARVRWSRVPRSGGQLEKIAEVKRLGAPSALAARDGAAYYTQAGKLSKLGPEVGASQVLYEKASSPPALHVDRLFFVECDKKGKADYVKELSAAGGPARTLAELAHAPGKSCEYPSLVADEREVMIGDWNGQRVLAVARRDGSQRTLITKRGFPQSLILEDHALTFLSARGLERVGREGGAPLKLLDNEHVAAPFSDAILRDGEYWLADQLAYSPTDHVFRLAYQGGTPQAVATFKQASPVDSSPSDSYLAAFTADEECVYWARTRPDGKKAELLARAKGSR